MSDRLSRLRFAGLACLLTLLAGCDELRLACPACEHPAPLTVGCPYAASELGPFYASSTITDPTLLILSGGGSHGAWGAGVIAGWPDDASFAEPRPDFTVVTGISSGALQATYAFAGKQHNGDLQQLFTQSTNSDIYWWKWNFMASNSLQSREPLKQILENQLTDALLLEVANKTAHELMVGTVNLDTSQFCPWNLSTIARKYRDATDVSKKKCWRNLYRDVVWAASGAPVIAPPVEIDSNACTDLPPQKMLHVDGGVRLRVFVSGVFQQPITSTSNPTAYVVMNGKMVTHPECVANMLAPIAARTFEIMDREALFGSLHALMDDPANKWKLKLSRVPDDTCLRFSSSEFDPPKLKCLFDAGSAWVKDPNNWQTTVPKESVAPWPAGCCPTMPKCMKPCTPAPTPCPM